MGFASSEMGLTAVQDQARPGEGVYPLADGVEQPADTVRQYS